MQHLALRPFELPPDDKGAASVLHRLQKPPFVQAPAKRLLRHRKYLARIPRHRVRGCVSGGRVEEEKPAGCLCYNSARLQREIVQVRETEDEKVDTKINALTEDVDATVRKELQQAWACLNDVGATAAATVIFSRLCTLLLDIVYARAGKQESAEDYRDSLSKYIGFAGDRDVPGKDHRRVKGLGLLPSQLASTLHGLRVQANLVDHAERSSGVLDPGTCESLYAQYLDVLKWVYCRYEHGPKLPDIYTPGCVPATSPPCPIPCALPVEPPCYTPVRDSGEDLDEVDELLTALRYDDCRLVALVGPPGFGKSARIAAALARVAPGGEIFGESIGAIIYKDCEDGGFDSQWLLRQFGRVFGREDYYVDLTEALRQPTLQTIAERALPDLSRRGATWIVLDNFQSLQTESGALVKETEELLETLLNRGGDVRVLIATRVAPLLTAGVSSLLRIFPVDDELSLSGAMALVTGLAEKRGTAVPSGEELEEVLRPLGGVPLYLKSLVGYLCDLPGPSVPRLRETEWFARFRDQDLTSGFSKLIHECYGELPFLQQHLLLSAAVLGVPAPLAVYQEMRPVGTAEEDVQAGLDALCRRFLLKREESGYAADHRQVSDILLQMIPAEPPEGASASPNAPEVELSAHLRTSLKELHLKAAPAWERLAAEDADHSGSLGFRECAARHFVAAEKYERAYVALDDRGLATIPSKEIARLREQLQQHLDNPDQQLGNLVARALDHCSARDHERAAEIGDEIWRRFPAGLNGDTAKEWVMAVFLVSKLVEPYGERMRLLHGLSRKFNHARYPRLHGAIRLQQAVAVSTLEEPTDDEKRKAVMWLGEAEQAMASASGWAGVFQVLTSEVRVKLREYESAMKAVSNLFFSDLLADDPLPDQPSLDHWWLVQAAEVYLTAAVEARTDGEHDDEALAILECAEHYADLKSSSLYCGFFRSAARFCLVIGLFDEALRYADKLAESTDTDDEEHYQAIGLTLAALRGTGRMQEASEVFAEFLAAEPTPSAMEQVRGELRNLSKKGSAKAGFDWSAWLYGRAASLSEKSGDNRDLLSDLLHHFSHAAFGPLVSRVADTVQDSRESVQAELYARETNETPLGTAEKWAARWFATSNPASLSEVVPLLDAVALICRDPELLDKAPDLCAQVLEIAHGFVEGLREDSRLPPLPKPTRRRRAAISKDADKTQP